MTNTNEIWQMATILHMTEPKTEQYDLAVKVYEDVFSDQDKYLVLLLIEQMTLFREGSLQEEVELIDQLQFELHE